MDKRRARANECEVMNLIGGRPGKSVILVDDMIDTAGTLCNAAAAVLEKGRGHPESSPQPPTVLSPAPALERLEKSPIEQVILLDTIRQPEERRLDKIRILPVAPVFSGAIERIYGDRPVSIMFK